ncbi:YggS family pyridoxal phosphate-dependent enzyme [bacterium]|nr:YggS family pyridoxal phosphate-dependent enzyme [bacterium]
MKSNLAGVQARIETACRKAGRSPSEVTLVAVSKTRPVEQTRELYDLGIRQFGESRVQEARDKIPGFPDDIVWHLIGRLQTNKAKYLPEIVQWVHSIDRLSVAEALEKAYEKADKVVHGLVQVSLAGEEQKAGVEPKDAEALVRAVESMPHIKLEGLMTIGPFVDDPEEVRPVFRRMAELAARLRESTGLGLPHLSMGMTNDFEVAIEEGATLVRVGTALYAD